ncbi:coiled-coil domain-containing protein 24 isoform X1 [Engystomops pustulosus]|uniref:coiled-coil domain-containing protein 24 isoform X1 n=1 Tax=Engystomops pustulosus TaxID=76066 RepID=UPI003AFA83A6
MTPPSSDQDSGYGESLEAPPSLWRLVEAQVPLSERDEIKRILGEAAVDLSLDLHAEVEVLLELWRDLRSSCPSTIQSPPILADPPVIKDMVTQEIRMLLLSVRMKARQQGLDEDAALCKYNPRVVNFVMGTGRPESRAGSRGSGRSRPSSGCKDLVERPLSSLSTGSRIEDELQVLKDKLQISHIDDVIIHLQSLLEDERRTLEKDIVLLQLCLEEERQYGEELQTLQAEPSLTELKEERRILERDLQLNQLPPTAVPTSKMAANKKSNSTRFLDIGRRGNPNRRLTPNYSESQYDPPLTPCPPDPKLKSPEGWTVRKSLTGSGAPSSAATASLRGPQEPGAGSTCCIQRISRGPGPHVTEDERIRSRAAQTPVRVPLPPKVQRPCSSPSLGPTFRKVRTNLPPEKETGVKNGASVT